MESQLLWFLLAGFILGFAASTLWEWLYFRGRRLATIGASPPQTTPDDEVAPPYEPAPAPSGAEAAYRSPAVFLEGEQPRSDAQVTSEPAIYEPLQSTTPLTRQTPAQDEPVRPAKTASEE
jgi:hypothetical protein